jgi:hypothetical protein
MPLEILVDTKRNMDLWAQEPAHFEKVDSLSCIASRPEMARPLSLAGRLKFARQAFYDMTVPVMVAE